MSTTTESIGRRAVRELREMVAKFGAGEAEIARTYFQERRSPEQDAVWMTSQAGRELSRVYQLWEAAKRELDNLGQSGDRYRLRDALEKAVEELNHFIGVAEVLEWSSGRPVDYAELHRYDFFRPDPNAPSNQENARLAEVNREIDRRVAELNPRWGPLVTDQGLLEGGGNGVFFALRELKGGEFEERLARVFLMIVV
jgi:hypothetical protein